MDSSGDFYYRARHYVLQNLNFYRIHLIIFCLTPLVLSAIMYASNGRFHISYVDALFNSVSAMTVTGLTTINLSGLTGWQQAILYVQMVGGNIVTVSWIMVLVRKHFFEVKVSHIVEGIIARRNGEEGGHPVVRRLPLSWTRKLIKRLKGSPQSSLEGSTRNSRTGKDGEKLRPDMIRRVSALPPQLLNPNGQLSIKTPTQEMGPSAPTPQFEVTTDEKEDDTPTPREEDRGRSFSVSTSFRNVSIQPPPDDSSVQPGGEKRSVDFRRGYNRNQLLSPTLEVREGGATGASVGIPRTMTIEFQEPEGITRRNVHNRPPMHHPGSFNVRRPSLSPEDERREDQERDRAGPSVPFTSHHSIPRTQTMHTTRSNANTNFTRDTPSNVMRQIRTRDRERDDVGFGGFPMPHEIIGRIVRSVVPKVSDKLQRTISVPARTMTIGSLGGEREAEGHSGLDMRTRTKSVPYISFDAVIGRNSQFYDLEEEELEELGGVEYRALSILLWLVPLYFIGTQIIAFVVIAPYVALPRWHSIFSMEQMRYLNSTWYSVFVVTSAFTNTGMSLVDQSMVPFKSAYPQIVFMIWIILAGNTCYPAFFRLTIWIGSKLVPRGSRTSETLQFLLDHPRRCFVYLFPSHQTWFLVAFVVILTLTDWVSFLVLDIGNAEIESIPVGERILDGILQSAAVRAAGFGIVTLGNLAPAVKVLYVTMMYVSVYPIALSVRSSNVYEERSLGLDEESVDSEDEEPKTKLWGGYLAWHARKQLAFDMWWIVLAVTLICIVERGKIDDANDPGIDIFPILFEVISAYGTVGLSLGAPGQNYSLSGALSPLSKVILCIVMIRGRHRGLPVAIDRAVMLPHEFRGTASAWSNFPTTMTAGTTANGGENGTASGVGKQKDTLSRNTAANATLNGGYPFPSTFSEPGHGKDDIELDEVPNGNHSGPQTRSPEPLSVPLPPDNEEFGEVGSGLDHNAERRKRTQSSLTPVSEG